MFRLPKLFLALSLFALNPICFSATDLDLHPVAIFKCWRALKKLNTKATPTIPTEISKKVGSRIVSVPTYPYLSSQQIKKMFEDYPEGGPAFASGLSYRTVDGSLRVLFWPQKIGPVENSISHRDAAETILKSELRAIKHYLSNPKNEKLQMMFDAEANLTGILNDLKNSSEVTKDITERFCGFQIRATRSNKNGEIKIDGIEFSKTFNGRSSIGPMFGWKEEFQEILKKVSNSISPKYRPDLDKVEWP